MGWMEKEILVFILSMVEHFWGTDCERLSRLV